MNKNRVSIVIPAYNEAAQLHACLQAIARQSVLPYEVIVVDNNSSDDTARVAQYYDFVSLLRETRQGVVHARTRGFNAARGDIIARLDSDTILPPNWVETVKQLFYDSSLAAVSGAPHYHDFALPGIADAIDHFLRIRLARNLGQENFLYGANMAIRRSVWRQVASRLCAEKGLHEDFDLAIHVQAAGGRVAYERRLVAGVSARRIEADFRSYVRYTLASPKTYAWHGLKSRRHMYPVLLVSWLCHPVGRLLQRCYDKDAGRFKMSNLFFAQAAIVRVDPTSNVA